MSSNRKLDNTHSELTFKVKHMMIAHVTGHIAKFNAEVSEANDTLTQAKINLTADLGSISTGNEQRDGHLKSADFFDVENHPELRFESSHFDGKLLKGSLTMKGVTHPVSLEVEEGGIGTDPWGNTRKGFTITGKLNRKDWGLNWNSALETGGVLVSDEVKINGEIQFVKS